MNALLEFLAAFFGATVKDKKPEFFPGVLLDDPLMRADDVPFGAIVTKVAKVDWPVLDDKKLPTWPVLNQQQTSACVAFTKALMSSIIYFMRTGTFLQFSPRWIYSQRANKPGEGMWGGDAFDIESKAGLVPEDMVPSEGLTEKQISDYTAQPWEKEVSKALRMSDQRVILPSGDIETIASVMQVTNKPVMLFFTFSYQEWTRPIPVILPGAAPLAHAVTFVPPRKDGEMSFGMYQGKKAVVIQDSWGIDANAGTIDGKRIVTEDFYKVRNYFAAYSMRFKFDEGTGKKPTYDGTFISVQKCLQYEGCFPVNVAFVENFGPVTKKSVAQFQAKYGLSLTSELDAPTVKMLKKLYP